MWYEIWQSKKDGKWYWHLKAKNGKIIADGGQGYARRWNLMKTLDLFRRVNNRNNAYFPIRRLGCK